MTKFRLDQLLVRKGLVSTRSQAESWIKLGKVTVDKTVITKPGFFAREDSMVELSARERYVSRAGLKLASVATSLRVSFTDTVVLDVGSSTGGFTDYALQHGARKVYAVDVGTDQLHPTLKGEARIELHEKTDILDFQPVDVPDVVVMDVSFISLRDILPHISSIIDRKTIVIAMVKPQFEASRHQVAKGVIKNDSVRRAVLKDFEAWARQYFVIEDKADSEVAGAKGNRERFYRLRLPL